MTFTTITIPEEPTTTDQTNNNQQETKGRCWCCWESDETPDNPLIRACLGCKDHDLQYCHQNCIDLHINNLPEPVVFNVVGNGNGSNSSSTSSSTSTVSTSPSTSTRRTRGNSRGDGLVVNDNDRSFTRMTIGAASVYHSKRLKFNGSIGGTSTNGSTSTSSTSTSPTKRHRITARLHRRGVLGTSPLTTTAPTSSNRHNRNTSSTTSPLYSPITFRRSRRFISSLFYNMRRGISNLNCISPTSSTASHTNATNHQNIIPTHLHGYRCTRCNDPYTISLARLPFSTFLQKCPETKKFLIILSIGFLLFSLHCVFLVFVKFPHMVKEAEEQQVQLQQQQLQQHGFLSNSGRGGRIGGGGGMGMGMGGSDHGYPGSNSKNVDSDIGGGGGSPRWSKFNNNQRLFSGTTSTGGVALVTVSVVSSSSASSSLSYVSTSTTTNTIIINQETILPVPLPTNSIPAAASTSTLLSNPTSIPIPLVYKSPVYSNRDRQYLRNKNNEMRYEPNKKQQYQQQQKPSYTSSSSTTVAKTTSLPPNPNNILEYDNIDDDIYDFDDDDDYLTTPQPPHRELYMILTMGTRHILTIKAVNVVVSTWVFSFVVTVLVGGWFVWMRSESWKVKMVVGKVVGGFGGFEEGGKRVDEEVRGAGGVGYGDDGIDDVQVVEVGGRFDCEYVDEVEEERECGRRGIGKWERRRLPVVLEVEEGCCCGSGDCGDHGRVNEDGDGGVEVEEEEEHEDFGEEGLFIGGGDEVV
ncbi:hypothetical protein HDU76_004384 [Blyttiomyces sp. JEL0837]|nr:hypothetical protein HDU76_004384 [Blyttiomyces sp. JEL0837]